MHPWLGAGGGFAAGGGCGVADEFHFVSLSQIEIS